jgi:hypothetical protein
MRRSLRPIASARLLELRLNFPNRVRPQHPKAIAPTVIVMMVEMLLRWVTL